MEGLSPEHADSRQDPEKHRHESTEHAHSTGQRAEASEAPLKGTAEPARPSAAERPERDHVGAQPKELSSFGHFTQQVPLCLLALTAPGCAFHAIACLEILQDACAPCAHTRLILSYSGAGHCMQDIDPEVLAALPKDIRRELEIEMLQQSSRRGVNPLKSRPAPFGSTRSLNKRGRGGSSGRGNSGREGAPITNFYSRANSCSGKAG